MDNDLSFYNQLIEKFNLDINEFYFLAYTNNKQAITVIDLNWCVEYEMDEWDLVEGIDDKYIELDEAISIAKNKANNKGIEYVEFDSRYHNELNYINNYTSIEELDEFYLDYN